MRIENVVEVDAPVDRVWALVNDIPRVAPCMPGAALTGVVDERTYEGTVAVKLGPLRMSYKGKVVVEEVDEAGRSARLAASGKDVKGAGTARATVETRLEPLGDARTRMSVASDVQLTGRVASFGRGGAINDVATRLFGEFADCRRAAGVPPHRRRQPGRHRGDGPPAGLLPGHRGVLPPPVRPRVERLSQAAPATRATRPAARGWSLRREYPDWWRVKRPRWLVRSRARRAVPAAADLLPGGRRAGQRSRRRGVQAVQQQRQVAVPELAGAVLVAEADGRHLLEHEGEVVDVEVGADRAGGLDALQEPEVELMGRGGVAVQLLGGGEGAGQA